MDDDRLSKAKEWAEREGVDFDSDLDLLSAYRMENPKPRNGKRRGAVNDSGPAPTDYKESGIKRAVTIRCEPGTLPEMTDSAESALIKHDDNVFQRAGCLVRCCVGRAETVRGITRPGGQLIILPIDAEYLVERLNRLVRWERWDERAKEIKVCNAPRSVANALLARRGLWLAQPLVAVISAPTLRPDGSILDKTGYDAATGLMLHGNGTTFEPIPENPTRQDALDALDFIKREVLSGFPFVADHDLSSALSAILTATVRHSLRTAPLHPFSAPVMASGKSLLADVVSLVATGAPATVMSFSDDPDEMRKRTLSVLMQGDAVINLDNISGPLRSDTLCTVLTQETFTDRILGVNKTATAPTTCTWLATGNNLTIAGDMTTRVVPCMIDPGMERPEEREFKRDLTAWIPRHRSQLIKAALTVLRAYVVAGRPKQPIKNFARFEDWSGWIRSALVWLCEADPLIGRENIQDADPVRIKLRALLGAWHSVFMTAGATAKEAVYRANEVHRDAHGNEAPVCPELFEVLSDHFTDRRGEISARHIGEFLKRYAGRVESGVKFCAAGESQRAVVWRVAVVDPDRFTGFCQKHHRQGELTHQTHVTHREGSPDNKPSQGNQGHSKSRAGESGGESGVKSESRESGESVSPVSVNLADVNVGSGVRV